METSTIGRLQAASRREAEKDVDDRVTRSEIQKLRDENRKSIDAILAALAKVTEQLKVLQAAQEEPEEAPPEYSFEIQRDGANLMTRVIAKPMCEKEGAE